ncbi:MAG: hypothetical protein ACFCVH_12545 [Alphaproteobacteria bacterium]
MTRYAGMVETRKVDRLLTSDELDREKRHALMQFKQELDAVIMSANQQVLKSRVPSLSRETITRMAVRVAELRGAYLAKALRIAEAQGTPDFPAIDELRLARFAFEEMCEAFEAMERVLDRGYTKLA